MTREEAIKCLADAKEEFAYFHNHCVAFDMAIEALKQPEQKKAKWVFGTTMNRGWMKCSNCCVCQTPCGTFSYCPNCGAEMGENNV